MHSPAPSRASTHAFSEKQQPIAQPAPSPGPPSYRAQSPPPLPPGREPPPQQQPQGIATVSALYAYKPTDAGDLELAINDRVTVLEWMNADWARGRSQRTGAEGIFPRSYAKIVEDEKAGMRYEQPAYQQQQWQQSVPYGQGPPPQDQGPGSYGNIPMAVAQGGQQQGPPPPESKVNTQGKKFGKKLGNAGKLPLLGNETLGSNAKKPSSVPARVLGRTLSMGFFRCTAYATTLVGLAGFMDEGIGISKRTIALIGMQ